MPIESARRTSPVCTGLPRNDSIIAPIGFAERTQMTGWGYVVTAVTSEIFPTLPTAVDAYRQWAEAHPDGSGS
jgi:hypothetical protein